MDADKNLQRYLDHKIFTENQNWCMMYDREISFSISLSLFFKIDKKEFYRFQCILKIITNFYANLYFYKYKIIIIFKYYNDYKYYLLWIFYIFLHIFIIYIAHLNIYESINVCDLYEM